MIADFTKAGALPHQLGVIYLERGGRAKALTLFKEEAKDGNAAALSHGIPEYYMRVLDGEPRFEALKRKLGIAV